MRTKRPENLIFNVLLVYITVSEEYRRKRSRLLIPARTGVHGLLLNHSIVSCIFNNFKGGLKIKKKKEKIIYHHKNHLISSSWAIFPFTGVFALPTQTIFYSDT